MFPSRDSERRGNRHDATTDDRLVDDGGEFADDGW